MRITQMQLFKLLKELHVEQANSRDYLYDILKPPDLPEVTTR